MQGAVNVAEVIEQCGVGFFAELNRFEQWIEGLLWFAKLPTSDFDGSGTVTGTS